MKVDFKLYMHSEYLSTRVVPDLQGIFIERPNRFLAKVKINDEDTIVTAHVHDSGRITDVLVKGARVLLKKADKTNRKTKFDVLFAFHKGYWVLINTKYHPSLAKEILTKHIAFPSKPQEVFPEYTIGESRLDFLIVHENKSKTFVEVKGCTLEENGKALFPDAPTTRGQKHLKTLIKIKKEFKKHNIMVLFLVFHPYTKCFSPNWEIDPKFSKLFQEAIQAGLEVKPVVLSYDLEQKRFKVERILPLCKNRDD